MCLWAIGNGDDHYPVLSQSIHFGGKIKPSFTSEYILSTIKYLPWESTAKNHTLTSG